MHYKHWNLFFEHVKYLKSWGGRPIHVILLVVLSHLAKVTSRTPESQSQRINSVYPDNANTLHKAELVPSIYPKMVELCNDLDKNKIIVIHRINGIQTIRKTKTPIFLSRTRVVYLRLSIRCLTDWKINL